MSLSRRGFIAACSTLVVPHEPQRIYSFAGREKAKRVAFDIETYPLSPVAVHPMDPEMLKKVERQMRKILQFGEMYSGGWKVYSAAIKT